MHFVSKNLKTLLIALALIVGAIVLSGYFHYRSLNLAEDPRIIEARKKMAEFNELMSGNETGRALLVLDQVEEIYKNTPGYEDSYEPGVIHNNRGSVYLVKAQTDLLNEKEPNSGDLAQARQYFEDSIDVYTNWLDSIGSMERSEVRSMTLPFSPQTILLLQTLIWRGSSKNALTIYWLQKLKRSGACL
jgi:hypothetical protein